MLHEAWTAAHPRAHAAAAVGAPPPGIADYNQRYNGAPRSVRVALVAFATPAHHTACRPRHNAAQLWAQVLDVPTLIRRAVQDVATGRLVLLSAVGIRLAVALLAGLLYLLSPLDIIPEALFGALGLLDDLAVCGASQLRTRNSAVSRVCDGEGSLCRLRCVLWGQLFAPLPAPFSSLHSHPCS